MQFATLRSDDNLGVAPAAAACPTANVAPDEPAERRNRSGAAHERPPRSSAASLAQFSEGNLSDFGLRERPTAELLVAGIEKAGREGRIPAWRDKSRTRYFEPEMKSGSWLTCCPAHDDHNPSFVASDGIDESGKPRLLVYCRSGCDQDKVIDALDTLGLWNCTPDTIDDLKAEAGVGKARPAPRVAELCDAIVPVPASSPLAPDRHPQLGPITQEWQYRDDKRRALFKPRALPIRDPR